MMSTRPSPVTHSAPVAHPASAVRTASAARPALASVVALLAAAALSVAPALSEAPAGKPAPGPENRKLGFFVGKWSAAGDLKPSPFMPGGKINSQDTCEWFDGGFAVVCHYNGIGPMGATKGLGILGYDTEEKMYTYYALDSGPRSMTTVPQGTEKDGTWVYLDESRLGGKMVRSRYTITETSPTSYSYKWEILGEDGAWQTILMGKSTRTSRPPA
jgi:hypothetical protein